MASPSLDELYGDAILDHRRHPRNPDKLDTPDLSARAVNPFCGDEVDLQIVLEGGRVAGVGAQGQGCSINQAAASMLSEAITGRTLDEVGHLSDLFRQMMYGDELSDAEIGSLGDLSALAGVRQYPVRIKCALLALTALEDAVRDRRKA